MLPQPASASRRSSRSLFWRVPEPASRRPPVRLDAGESMGEMGGSQGGDARGLKKPVAIRQLLPFRNLSPAVRPSRVQGWNWHLASDVGNVPAWPRCGGACPEEQYGAGQRALETQPPIDTRQADS